MLQRVRIALLVTFAGIAVAGDSPPRKSSPFQLKFDSAAKIPYSDALVKELLTDAQTHGDVRRGAAVFGAPTSACLSCHKVGKQGGDVGPNLSTVGACLPPEAVVEAVFWPNRTVKPEYKAVAIEDAKGRVLQGIVKQESAAEIVLQDAAGKLHHLPRKEIEDRREIGSLMPDGLTAAMTPEQRRDLVRYLLELGKIKGLEGLHEPATFAYPREPLRPEDWPNRTHYVNRDRVYDFYTRAALYFRGQKPPPLLLPEWPGLDGGTYGHWGNQNDDVWRDNRWNQTDLGTLQCGVFRKGWLTVPRGVCVRLGEQGELAACFNPDTLQVEALWQGGFVRFTDHRFGFMDGIRPAGQMLPTPARIPVARPFVYHGFYRHGNRTIFSYQVGGVEMLDAPWVENGKFTREVAPADRHSLASLTCGGKLQWPQVFTTTGSPGVGRPYAIDTIEPPFKNAWNALPYFGGLDFFADGSAVLCTMQGDVWHVEGLDATLRNVRWRRIAAGLHHALGLVVVDRSVFVLGRDQITRLVDLNGDGEADFYECFSNAYVTSPAGHDFTCGLERDAAGNFYTASGNQGLLRISPDGRKADVLATGFRNPDGLGLTPAGVLTIPCSEGEWTPASMICELIPRTGVRPHFGYGGPRDGKPPELPLAYLPRGVDNSSGGQVYVSSDKWGPLQGQRIHLSFGAASHFLLLRDEANGQAQGAIVPLVGDFRSGVHRGRFHPKDGQLYVCGMSGWGSYAAADGCFQRVRYTGDPVQLPQRFHVHQNGVLVEFTQPLDRAFVEKEEHHFAQAWNYRYSSGYGSPEYSPSHYGVPGHDPVRIASVHLRADGLSLFFEMPELQPVNQLHLNVGIARGRTCDLFVTVHQLGEAYRELPNYRESTRPIAAHPILKDLALAARHEPNPWRRPIPQAREVKLVAGKNLTFATPTVRVKAGEAIRLTFHNPDVVPHNWVLVKPGMLRTVGDMANRLIADPDAVARNYVPKAKKVIVYTDVVPPQGKTTIHFRAPVERGRYPFLCTFPGHWMVMNGEMIVEAAPRFAAEGDPPASAEVTAAMKPYLDGYKLAGVIAIVADKTGKVHYKNLLGYSDVEAKKPIREDNVFWIASMTKMFAGASVMMLVDEGKISLDDPATKFIPQLKKWMVVEEKDQSHVLLKPLVRPVTVRHLLSHTSGLAGASELQQVMGADSIPLKARALSSVTGPLQWQPGDKYAYGTQSMNIAARIVEIVSGMPYEQFLQKRFFDPLGMKETTFWPSEAQMARLAGAYGPNKEKNGYARGGIGFLRKPLHDRAHRYPEAGGGLFSTTHDIFRYGLMLANDGELDGKRYLSHAAMDELRKEQTGKTMVNYSLGYHLRNGMFGHDGAYGTDLSVNPKTGMVGIFLVQCTGGDQWAARDLFLKTATQIFPK